MLTRLLVCFVLILRGIVGDECVQDCTTADCIRSQDWNNAGPGWGSLHNAVVEECNSVRSTKLKANNGRDEYHSRHELWEDFKQFQQNVRNSTNDTDDGRTFRLLFFKFLSLKTKVENGERKIEDIIKSSKDESTNYKNQAIIVLQQDRTVQTAAINLYYKHPEVSTIYLYDKKTKKYTLVAGKEQSFGKNSRIQIVGHAGDKSGEMLFSKLNGEELARAVSAIPGIKNNVGRIGLVGCNAGKSEKFLTQFLRSLKNDMNIEATVSARKGVVTVTDSGRKLVGEITEDGFVWPDKSEDQKVVLKLDKNNEIKKIKESPREYVETSCKNCDREVLMDDVNHIKDLKKLKITNSDGSTSQILSPEEIDKFLTMETSNTFKNNVKDLLPSSVDTKTEGFQFRDIDIYNNKLTYRKSPDGKIIEQPIAAAIETTKVKLFRNGHVIIPSKEVQVRTFSTPQQFIDEINLWGLIGPLMPEKQKDRVRFVHYQIGDYIYIMNPINFYIYFHGIPESVEWKWKNKGRDVDYEHANLKHYPDLWNSIDKGDILNVLDNLLDGKMELLDRVSPVDIQFALAIGFAETIRNFRNYPVLKHAIELNRANKLTVDRFRIVNPMTRGGSWNIFGDRERSSDERSKIDPGFPLKKQVKKTGFYGFEGISFTDRSKLTVYGTRSKTKYGNNVLPREINVVQQHILNNLEKTYTVEQRDDNFNSEDLPEMKISDINTILGKPLEPDNIHQKVLSESDQLQNRYDMSDEKMVSVNAVKLEIMLEMDRMYLEKLVANDLQTFLEQSNGDYFFVEHSIEITDDTIKYSVQNKNNKNMIKELSVKYEKSKLQITKILDNLNNQAETKIAKKSKLQSATATAGKINDLLDVQGILAGFGNAIDNFSNGNIKDGSISLAQSVHGSASIVGELTGLSKSIRKGIGSFSRKTLSQINKHVSSAIGTTKQISTLGKAGRIFSKIPFVSLGFGIYSAITNFQSGTIKGYINFGFDVLGMAISTAAIAFPPLEIISLVLGVIQIGFNEFWNSISNAWNELDENATIGDKVVAVLKGIGMGLKSLFQQFTLIGQIWGAIEQVNDIKNQQQKDQQFLREIRDINNYYKIENRGEQGSVINFAAGAYSWNGGDIQFMLGDDGYATITTIPTTYLDHLIIKLLFKYKLTKRIYVGRNTNSIVAGFGQTHKVKYTRQSAKIFWFIPVYSADLISGMDPVSSSLRGIYYGNSNDNTFYTVQELPDSYRNEIHYTLEEYTYSLHGEGGNDMFFLGPQTAHVEGGPGYDYYYVPSYGGFIYINNYAKDMKHDILYIDCKITDISATRHKSDLILNYRYSHIIKIKNWYTSDKYRHMSFRADDGIIFNVSQTAFGNPRVEAMAVIMQGEKSGKTVSIQTTALRTVVLVVGSDFNDNVYGNSGNNKIIGGKGDDYMYGANGKDIYEINTGDGCDIINNYAADEEMDIVIISLKYSDVSIDFRNSDLLLTGKTDICVYLKKWFVSKKYRHLTFLSSDGILFEVSGTKNNIRKEPFTIYMENDRYGSNTVNISASEYRLVKTVIGSSQSDTIYGNHHGNILNGGKGNDMIAGGEGSDSYIMREDGDHDIVDNFAEDKTLDIIFFQESYINIKVSISSNDLVISSSRGFSVTVKNWFKDERFQHLKVRTTDGVEFFLPFSKDHFVGKIPVTIDKSKYGHGVRVDANQPTWQSVFKIIGSNYTDVLKGNLLNNVIEPKQGGGYFSGNNGSDKYIIEYNAGSNNFINNFALDENTDIIDIDVEYEDINVTDISNISVRLVGPNNLGVTLENFLKGTEYQHLIIESSDGVGFGIDNETLSTQPLVIDKSGTDSDQVIDVDNGELLGTKNVFGSLNQPNDINGNLEDNVFIGGTSVDTLKGFMGNDFLNGGNGQDVLMGGDGEDTIVGGEGSDWISGDFGDDVIFAGNGADNVVGGPGSDTIVFAGNISAQTGVFVDIQSGRGISSDAEGDIYLGVENIIGTEFDDILIGNDKDNDIYGFGGNDVIFPNGGNDILNGGDGNDIYALETSSGMKFLFLESKDNSSDTITLTNTKGNQIRAHKHSKYHLLLQVGYYKWLFWCPNKNNFGPFIISNWSHNEQRIQFQIIFEDVQMYESWFISNAHEGDINIANQFFCENPFTITAMICTAIIITIIILLCCLQKRCRKRRNRKKPKTDFSVIYTKEIADEENTVNTFKFVGSNFR